MISLMLGALSPRPARTASELVVRLDGMDLPLSINDLGGWLRGEERGSTELSVWLNLLEQESRQGVIDLLKAPLINDRSMARQILNSWAGRRLLDQVSDLVMVDDDGFEQEVINIEKWHAHTIVEYLEAKLLPDDLVDM